MRRPVLFRTAMALLSRVDGSGPYGDAIRGDLLEEFARTGDEGRFFREVMRAGLRGGWRRCGELLQPVAFSAGWGLMYPVWQAVEGGRVWPALAQRSVAMEWPYSSVALLASAGLSPLLYVWCGALLYLARNERAASWSLRWFHAVRGLSLSLSVLLVSWMVLMRYTVSEGVGVRVAGEVASSAGVHLSWLSLSLMLSVLVATFPSRPSRSRSRMRTR